MSFSNTHWLGATIIANAHPAAKFVKNDEAMRNHRLYCVLLSILTGSISYIFRKAWKTMKTHQSSRSVYVEELQNDQDTNLPIDFSHPDIMKARAQAYALLLQWRKEREAQARRITEEEPNSLVNPSTNLRNSTIEVYCHETESPTSAATEVG